MDALSLQVSSPAQQTGLANQSSSEHYRNGPVDFYYAHGSPWLKSVGDVLIVPKAIKAGCLHPSGFAHTVGSLWVGSPPYVQHGKQRCM